MKYKKCIIVYGMVCYDTMCYGCRACCSTQNINTCNQSKFLKGRETCASLQYLLSVK